MQSIALGAEIPRQIRLMIISGSSETTGEFLNNEDDWVPPLDNLIQLKWIRAGIFFPAGDYHVQSKWINTGYQE